MRHEFLAEQAELSLSNSAGRPATRAYTAVREAPGVHRGGVTGATDEVEFLPTAYSNSGGSMLFMMKPTTSLRSVRMVRTTAPPTMTHSAANEPPASENTPRNWQFAESKQLDRKSTRLNSS